MAYQPGIGSLHNQILTTILDLGFKASDARINNFYHLCIQYAKVEGDRVSQENEAKKLGLSPSDILDYAAITFIQNHGEALWPNEDGKRGHLSGQYECNGGSMDRRDAFRAETHQDRVMIPGERSMHLYRKKLESPLGSRVRKFFDLVKQMATAGKLPDIGEEATSESVERFVKKVWISRRDEGWTSLTAVEAW